MTECRPVAIHKNAFLFCKAGLAVIAWIAVIFQSWEIFAFCAVILGLSAILTVKNAPMILVWNVLFHRFFPSHDEILDAKGMRFAHTLGTILAVACAALLHSGFSTAGLILSVAFAILKTSGACGFCSALRLYNCMNSGTCCQFMKRRDA